MAQHVNKFLNPERTGGVNLRDITKNIDFSSTSAHVKDISIDLIDEDELNEQLFGYEDLYKIEESFETIGNKSVISVYAKPDGRYLCFSGTQRLKAARKSGDKKITCVVDGKVPESKEERAEKLLFMNAQRESRPYYIAQQLKAYEQILRKRGEKNPAKVIEKKFGIKDRMQHYYKNILKLNPVLQELFKRNDISFAALLDKCIKIPEGSENAFVKKFISECEACENAMAAADKAFAEISKVDAPEKAQKRPKTSQVFKTVLSLPYYDPDEEIKIPEKKKKEVLDQIDELEKYVNRLKEACR